MKVKRKNIITGEVKTMDLKITDRQLYLISSGQHVQNVCPDLSEEEREFLITGIPMDEYRFHLFNRRN